LYVDENNIIAERVQYAGAAGAVSREAPPFAMIKKSLKII
jgi:hypothetical protein